MTQSLNVILLAPNTARAILPPGVPLFRFPKSRIGVGNIGGQRVNARRMRYHLNTVMSRPWDTPIYEVEIRAIRDWEAQYGIVFATGHGMAEYDPGLERVRE